MTYKENFLSAREQFDTLVDRLDTNERKAYDSMTHVRLEDAFAKRAFYVYQMRGGKPVILDIIKVQDFVCNHNAGASAELVNNAGDTLLVGYEPVLLFDYPVFTFLPLHCKIRWSLPAGRPIDQGSLAFPLGLRTQSRFGLRESGVVYCETSTRFAEEFGAVAP